MAEYIERKKVIHEIDAWLDSVGTVLVGKGLSYYGELLGCVEDVPAADVVSVVRCKDCEYGEQADEMSYICENGAWFHMFCWADDFCGRGIRREK